MSERPSAGPSRNGFLLFNLVALGGALFDLLAKAWVFRWLPEGSAPVDVWPPVLRISRVMNFGIVWGLFQGYGGTVFLAVSLAALPLLVGIASRTGRLWPLAGLAAVTAGTAGNLYDRILFGGVRDFLAVDLGFMNWPDFNVADSMICVGVGILLVTWGRATDSADGKSKTEN